MAIIQKMLRPGVLYVVWQGEITRSELMEAQDGLLRELEASDLPRHLIILEVKKNTQLPHLGAMVALARRFPRGSIDCYVVITSLFNEMIADLIEQFAPVKLKIFFETEKAIEASKLWSPQPIRDDAAR